MSMFVRMTPFVCISETKLYTRQDRQSISLFGQAGSTAFRLQPAEPGNGRHCDAVVAALFEPRHE